jgi:hypothetical protein
MMTTLELADKIAEQVDEVDIIELLNLTTYDIVQAFLWKVEDRADSIIEQLEL